MCFYLVQGSEGGFWNYREKNSNDMPLGPELSEPQLSVKWRAPESVRLRRDIHPRVPSAEPWVVPLVTEAQGRFGGMRRLVTLENEFTY